MTKQLTYTIDDFRRSIDPNIYKKGGVARIEHFDTVNGQLRQQTTPTLSTSVAYGSSITANKLKHFAFVGNKLYALGKDSSTGYPAVFEWDSTAQNWKGLATFGSGDPEKGFGLVAYKGDLYGAYNLTNIFKVTTAGVATPAHAARTYTSTSTATPFVHSKDNLAYFFFDNTVYSFDGTTVTAGPSLPTNFLITAACEDGDYIFMAGYDSDNKATGYLWDRDSSLATMTAKYDLGRDYPYACARLGGTTFIVSKRIDSGLTDWTDRGVLVVRYRNGDRADILSEHEMPTLGMAFQSYFSTSHDLYFGAYAKLRNDASAKNIIFGLNHLGQLYIPLNMGVNSAITNPCLMTGIYREGDGWWVAGSSDGSWHCENTQTATSTFETNVIRSDDLRHNVNFRGAIVTCDPLPSGATIAVKARINNAVSAGSWTTLTTFSTANATKFALSEVIAKNALSGMDRAKQIQLQLVATGIAGTPAGAVIINGFQVTYEEVSDENHG